MAAAGGQVATWTVLFTDMVASTERRVRVGEDVFDRVRADLDRRVDRAVQAHDGTAVKSTGDGILAGFAATASALRCAAAIQAAVRDRNRETSDDVALRIGISVGDAVVEDGDIQGTAVVEAARLCDLAEPGTILCSGAVRAVSANRSGCAFGEARSMELKGLPGPVVVYEVILNASVERPDGRALTFRVLGPVEVERDGRVVAVGGPRSGSCWRSSSRREAPPSRWTRWSTPSGASAHPALRSGPSTLTSRASGGRSNPGDGPGSPLP